MMSCMTILWQCKNILYAVKGVMMIPLIVGVVCSVVYSCHTLKTNLMEAGAMAVERQILVQANERAVELRKKATEYKQESEKREKTYKDKLAALTSIPASILQEIEEGEKICPSECTL